MKEMCTTAVLNAGAHHYESEKLSNAQSKFKQKSRNDLCYIQSHFTTNYFIRRLKWFHYDMFPLFPVRMSPAA